MKIEKAIKSVKNHIPIITEGARANFERFAEEMNPEDYIKMRSYLSDIEMNQLYESGIF